MEKSQFRAIVATKVLRLVLKLLFVVSNHGVNHLQNGLKKEFSNLSLKCKASLMKRQAMKSAKQFFFIPQLNGMT